MQRRAKQLVSRSRGSTLAEGVVGLMLICLVFIAGVLLITALSTVSYYKYKLGCITNPVVNIVAEELGTSSEAQTKTVEIVDRMLKDIGLPPASSVTVSQSGQLVTVSITVAGLPLLQGLSNLPMKVTLSDTAVCPIITGHPPGLLTLTTGKDIVQIPVYGQAGSFSYISPAASKARFQGTIVAPSGSSYSYVP